MNTPTKAERYQNILREMKAAIDQLAQPPARINVGALNDAYDKLAQQATDITGLEDEIDALRRQIIDPVNAEIKKGNRTSWIFGIVGTVIGAIGVGLALLSNPNAETLAAIDAKQQTIVDSAEDAEATATEDKEFSRSVVRQLSELLALARAERFLPTDVAPVEGEKRLGSYESQVVVAEGNGHQIAFYLTNLRPEAPQGLSARQLLARIQIYEDGSQLSEGDLKGRVRVESALNTHDIGNGYIDVWENDIIVIGEIHRFAVTRIRSREPFDNTRGATESAVYVQSPTGP